jgi:hypothetical protein
VKAILVFSNVKNIFYIFSKKSFDCFSEMRYMRLISASHFRIVVNPWYSQKPQNRTQQQAQRSGANKQNEAIQQWIATT